ncbi:hypothetical protein DRW03_20890 [Corallococcus sp. H22C18031201]|uniref:hypothetical protein n=1 Tax=Citreicoccus inhibens TaxID=2849499 RepID=UPI000E758DDF|nr:hypothetical protein [Citreicoccus inhibens]MBU8895793.1 hypothetical protein [Citreicoccus inhibens]RJS20207.1 hypothetical protein DRW03_20890 [Corallococcus sp. H22C18031201]
MGKHGGWGSARLGGLACVVLLGGACSSTRAAPTRLAQVTPGMPGQQQPDEPGMTTGLAPPTPPPSYGQTDAGTGGSGATLPTPYSSSGGGDAGLSSSAVLPPGTGTAAPGMGGAGTTVGPDTNTSGDFLPAPSGSVIDGGMGR